MVLVKTALDMQLENRNITVAVYMITYNHEAYIQEAIESVLMQKTDFKYKLFIGEDLSTDNTRKICVEVAKQYSDKIELFLHPKNIGAVNNAQVIYRKCFDSGAKYIAMLEGDDYWTDPYKLQKQVDFLEANDELSMCYTRAKTLDNQSEKFQKTIPNLTRNHTLNLENYLLFNQVLPTASMFFKREDIDINLFKELVKITSFGDGILTLLAFLNPSKRVCILNEITTVYRVNNSESITYTKNMEQYISSWILMLQNAKKYFPTNDQKKAIQTGILFQKTRLSSYYIENKQIRKGILCIFSAIPYFSLKKKHLIKDLLYPLKKMILKK